MSILIDNLLLEIFLRLPNARSVIQCGTVCKRWFCLLSDPQFIQFRSNHKPQFDSPLTILFRRFGSRHSIVGELFTEESKILHGSSSSNYLNFVPHLHSLDIKASSRDLLLVSPDFYGYCICNPLTRQWISLPEFPRRVTIDFCGLLCEPAQLSCCHYKVLVLFGYNLHEENDYVFEVGVFSSETGKWSQSTLSYPKTMAPGFHAWDFEFIPGNGILYNMLVGSRGVISGFFAFDLSSGTDDHPIQCRLFHLPIDFVRGSQAHLHHVCYGVVQGRLRLSQSVKIEDEFVLKFWELNAHNNSDLPWRLVKEVSLERCDTDRIFVAAFHPSNEDVIFMLCDHDLCDYKIGERKYKKLGQLRRKYPKHMVDELAAHIRKVTLEHPSWPTLIPTLPSV